MSDLQLRRQKQLSFQESQVFIFRSFRIVPFFFNRHIQWGTLHIGIFGLVAPTKQNWYQAIAGGPSMEPVPLVHISRRLLHTQKRQGWMAENFFTKTTLIHVSDTCPCSLSRLYSFQFACRPPPFLVIIFCHTVTSQRSSPRACALCRPYARAEPRDHPRRMPHSCSPLC